ncbi:MAG: phenylacetate--CoA ligase family protein, partial [Dolichospermum sp.]
MKSPTETQNIIQELTNFISLPVEEKLQLYPDHDLEITVIKLFQKVAANVPADQEFLAKAGIKPDNIQTLADFQKIPKMNQENYIAKSPVSELCYHGKIDNCDFIAASSGSTGKSTFWPRFLTDELHIATRFEQILHNSFYADSQTTLAVICFSLGTWVGGMFTTNCCRYLAAKGYPLTVITP